MLKITALGVALTAEKIPDRPAVSESEVSKEIEYFDTAVDNTDDSLSRAKEAETMLRILENMKKKQLDPAKFLRYLMQELASK